MSLAEIINKNQVTIATMSAIVAKRLLRFKLGTFATSVLLIQHLKRYCFVDVTSVI